MKKYFYLSLILLSLGFISESKAQVRVNINIGSQPLWGPVGYDYARFYYMPEIDVYYNVSNRKYTYYHGNRWVTKSNLPRQYRHLDLYRTYKVVINDRNPWEGHDRYRRQYRQYSHNHSQVAWRDRGRDSRHGSVKRDDRRYDDRRSDDRHRGDDRKGRGDRRHNR